MCFVVCEIQLFQQANKNTTSTWYILEQGVCHIDLNTLELVSLSLRESKSIPQSSLTLGCGHRQNPKSRRATEANTGQSKPWTPCYLSSQEASVVTALSGAAHSYIRVLLKKFLSPTASKKKKKRFSQSVREEMGISIFLFQLPILFLRLYIISLHRTRKE